MTNSFDTFIASFMTSLTSDFINNFHFIRPLWLLSFIALFFVLYLLKKLHRAKSGWQQFLPPHLAKHLLEGNTANKNNSNKKIPSNNQNVIKTLVRPFIIGTLAIIALAGPTWQKLPQPVYQVERGAVLIMDMSYSMFATDLMPNRLTRARFKAIDLLDKLNEGDTGLIAYAGDAFIISPLTEDVNNIKLLLPALSPDIMPELGSNPISALMLADDMLRNSGHIEGDIYWFTDGIDPEDIQDINEWSREHNHQINILGIGTQDGAPITLTNGELLKDSRGAIVVPKLTPSYLSGIAKRANGSYQSISTDNRDIENLLSNKINEKNDKQSESLKMGDQYKEAGPYLVLLILPLLLSYFRRGNFLLLLPFALLLASPQQAQASIWQDLWKTQDQQAKDKFEQQDYQAAAEQFTNKNWQASALYKAKEYDKALEAFKQADPEGKNAQSLYNQGNSLAQLQKIDEAIEAYQKALDLDPELSDAKENKEKLEELKKQQQEQKNQQGDSSQDSSDQEKSDKNNSDQEKQKNEQQSDSSQEKQDQQGEQQNSDKNDQQEDQQTSQQNSENEQQANDNKKQSAQEQEKQAKEQQEAQANKANDEKQGEQTAEQQVVSTEQEKLDQELAEKHQQLLNKVTDDPYLLLRNKMRLEYQKRRQEGSRSGGKKQW
jgi:Ca-activated chloride channel family protein